MRSPPVPRREAAAVALVAAAALSACHRPQASVAPLSAPALVDDGPAEAFADEPIRPLPRHVTVDPARAALGRRLFEDRRLSSDGTVACATCHAIENAGADPVARSRGVGGAELDVNTPTVLNAAYNFAQFWDGRARTLEEQVDGPLQGPAEMGSSWPQVLSVIRGDASYRAAFAEAYPGGISESSVRDAIATYERTLTTPDAPIDRWLRGDATALSPEQLEGYRLFKSLGCVSCHQGVNVGGNMYQTLGRMRDWFADHGTEGRADQGRFNVTGLERDRHRFKVPSLRNVARTAPYLHDGSVPTLEGAVQVMATYQLGTELSAGETARVVAFLHALTGPVHAD